MPKEKPELSEAMKKKFDIDGVDIDLTKNIPRGSGLGGGSSNAASIMKGIRELYSLSISDKELEDIASQIRADVPLLITSSNFSKLVIAEPNSCLTSGITPYFFAK